MECRRGESTMEPMRTSPMQPRQRQKLLSRPLYMADGPGQDPETDQGLGVNSFKTIGGKPSRHRSTGGEHHCSSSRCPQPPRQSIQRCHKYSSTTPLYNMDRTAGTKATSSVAIQADSFQDHLVEISELVQTDPFQDHFRRILEIGAN